MNPDRGRIDRFLRPGDCIVGDARYRLRTLLGSCVSITLWHPHTRIGAMSHFLLPSRTRATGDTALDPRYGDEAVQVMLRGLARHGVHGGDCVARLFGGGDMFPDRPTRPHSMDVGRRNGEAARVLAQRHGLRIGSEQLFGVGHRQVVFDVVSGDVRSQQVAPDDVNTTRPLSLTEPAHL